MDSIPFHNYRRSTRVPLKVAIEVLRGNERFMCEAQTIVVNLHGALISSTVALSTDLHISIHVHLTDKRANARVVYIDPQNPFCCGVELDAPRNIWGVSLPPDDWRDRQREFESGLDDLCSD
jgi:PilZ domain